MSSKNNIENNNDELLKPFDIISPEELFKDNSNLGHTKFLDPLDLMSPEEIFKDYENTKNNIKEIDVLSLKDSKNCREFYPSFIKDLTLIKNPIKRNYKLNNIIKTMSITDKKKYSFKDYRLTKEIKIEYSKLDLILLKEIDMFLFPELIYYELSDKNLKDLILLTQFSKENLLFNQILKLKDPIISFTIINNNIYFIVKDNDIYTKIKMDEIIKIFKYMSKNNIYIDQIKEVIRYWELLYSPLSNLQFDIRLFIELESVATFKQINDIYHTFNFYLFKEEKNGLYCNLDLSKSSGINTILIIFKAMLDGLSIDKIIFKSFDKNQIEENIKNARSNRIK